MFIEVSKIRLRRGGGIASLILTHIILSTIPSALPLYPISFQREQEYSTVWDQGKGTTERGHGTSIHYPQCGRKGGGGDEEKYILQVWRVVLRWCYGSWLSKDKFM
jgi:hypothetical protein